MNLFEKFPTIDIPKSLDPKSIRKMWMQWQAIDTPKHRVVLLKGQPGTFCLGMNLDWVAHQNVERSQIEAFSSFLKTLMDSPIITIALVDGVVTGGGLGIVSACDFVVATDQSTFRLTEGLIGLVPGVILTALLNRLSRQTLKRMVFSAHEYTVSEALNMGLVDEITTDEALNNRIQALINEVVVCKKQSTQDLKVLLGKALDPSFDLTKEGALLLEYRLADAGMKNRLCCIANLMKAIITEDEKGFSSSSIS